MDAIEMDVETIRELEFPTDGPVMALSDDCRMDVFMIHALLVSLLNIFATMVRIKIRPAIPVPKQDRLARGAVSSVIGMQAAGASGSVALSLPLPAISAISRSLFGNEITVADQEAADLAGELTNMLVGGAKKILSENGHDFDMQTPQLLLGESHEIVHHCAGQTVLLPVSMEAGEFYLELNFV